ncbi:MAG: acyl--CoA ligase [Frankia sp.]|nr:acyl--CoA ligase [Frankia sp.]
MTATVVDAGDGLPLTVPALLRARAAEHGSRVLVAGDGDALSYGEAEKRSAALARGLLAVGAGKGTHVGLLYPAGRELVVSWLAAARIGAVTVPLSTSGTPGELRAQLRGADVGILLSARSSDSHCHLAGLQLDLAAGPGQSVPTMPVLRRLFFADPPDDATSGAPAGGDGGSRRRRSAPPWTMSALLAAGEAVADEVLAAAEDAVRPADRLAIVHTPRPGVPLAGAIHAHGPLIRHLANLTELRGLAYDEVLVDDSPFLWAGSFVHSLLGALLTGGRLARPHPPATAEARRPGQGSAWPWQERPGTAGTGSVCLVDPRGPGEPAPQRGTAVRPAPGFEARVVDPADGSTCGPGRTGELWLRGPFMMEGHYGRERHEVFDPDGWFHTGDLVTVGDDGLRQARGSLRGQQRSAAEPQPGGPADQHQPLALTIPALVAARCRRHPDLAALVTEDASLTYAELDDTSRALAARLVRAGVTKGSRVGLVLPNGVDWATLALAVTRVGAVLVPLSTLLRPPELLAQLRTADVTHLVVATGFRGRDYLAELESQAPGLVERVRAGRRHPAVPALRQIWTPDTPPTPAQAGNGAAGLVRALEQTVRPADDLVILFTSGSSGGPKGVVHTHGNALRAVACGLASRRVEPGERLYIPMPFFWTGGFSGGLLTALVAGATLLTEAVPEPGRTLAFLARERATLFRGWPDQAARIAAHPDFASTDLSSLRPASLPAILPPDQRPAPGARANLFGMTESFGPYCGSRLDRDLPAGKHGSCGQPFPGVEVRIVDPRTGAPVPPGTEGEIRLRGPNLMRGICGRTRADVFDADGFYPTADAGVLDEDGYLWYRGRLDDMFKVRGATVYPREVEEALRALPEVAAAFVTDVPAADGARQVAALVVTRRPVELARLAEAVRSRLSSFKVPTRWFLTDDQADVPLLASGKIDARTLRTVLEDRGTGLVSRAS